MDRNCPRWNMLGELQTKVILSEKCLMNMDGNYPRWKLPACVMGRNCHRWKLSDWVVDGNCPRRKLPFWVVDRNCPKLKLTIWGRSYLEPLKSKCGQKLSWLGITSNH